MKGGRGDWAFAPTFYSRFTAVSMPSSWMGGRGGEYEGLRRAARMYNALAREMMDAGAPQKVIDGLNAMIVQIQRMAVIADDTIETGGNGARFNQALGPESFKATVGPLRRGLKLVNATVDPLKAKQDALNALDLASNALTASNGLITAPGGRVEASKAIKALIETAAHVANKPSEERIEALGEMPEIVRAVLQADDPEKLAAIEGALYAETPGAEWMTALRAFSD